MRPPHTQVCVQVRFSGVGYGPVLKGRLEDYICLLCDPSGLLAGFLVVVPALFPGDVDSDLIPVNWLQVSSLMWGVPRVWSECLRDGTLSL